MFRSSTAHAATGLTAGMFVTCADGDWQMPRTALPWDRDVYAAHVLTAPQKKTFATRHGPHRRRGHLDQYTFLANISGRVRQVYVPAGQLVNVGASLQDWTSCPAPVLSGAAA